MIHHAGGRCGWDNPNAADPKRGLGPKLRGFLHIGGQEGIDDTLPTFCEDDDEGYCSATGMYSYSSAFGNLGCWNTTLGLAKPLETYRVKLESGWPYSRGVQAAQDVGTGLCYGLQGTSIVACRSHVDHKFDPFYTNVMAAYIEQTAQNQLFQPVLASGGR